LGDLNGVMSNNINNIKEILNKIGYLQLKDLGTDWQTRPLFRDSDNDTALVIKKDSGIYYDFVERRGGNFSELVQRTLRLPTYQDAEKILKDNNFEDAEIKSNKYESHITMQKVFPKQMLLKLIHDNSYWNKRGISNETLDIFKGGITFNGRMTGRYVFPIENLKNELVGFVGRKIYQDNDFVPWKIIGKKSEWIYPIQSHKYIREKKQVILVESIGDFLSLCEVGVKNILVLFGVNLSPAIISLLLKYDVSKIHICLNNDEEKNSVGNNAAQEIAGELTSYFDKSQINLVTLKFKDFNEWLLADKDGLEKFCKENL
jgi:DNA primase